MLNYMISKEKCRKAGEKRKGRTGEGRSFYGTRLFVGRGRNEIGEGVGERVGGFGSDGFEFGVAEAAVGIEFGVGGK